MLIFSLIYIGLSHQINILGDDDDGGGGGGGGGSGGGNCDVMVMVSYHEYDIRQQNSIQVHVTYLVNYHDNWYMEASWLFPGSVMDPKRN